MAFLISFEIDGKMLNATEKRVRAIDYRHIPHLVQIAEDYKNEQLEEIAQFDAANPT